MPTQRRSLIKKAVYRTVDALSSRRTYDHFNWVTIWTITRQCNLRCKYCYVDFVDYNPENFRRGLDHILSHPPKWLILHGGEPTSVPDLPDALRRIREVRPDIFVTSESNLTYKSRTMELAELVNHFEISWDGLGDINKQTRGISGDVIERHLRELAPKCRDLNVKLSISVVISTINYRHLGPLIERMQEIEPNMDCIFFVLHPKSNPMSVAHRDDTFQEFLGILKDLQRQYPGKITYPEAMPVQDKLRCFAQFFVSHIHETGEPYYCKRSHHLAAFQERQFSGRGWRGVRDFAEHSWQLFDSLVFRRFGPTCMKPCDWGYNIEKILFSPEGADTLARCHPLHGAIIQKKQQKQLNLLLKKARTKLTVDDITKYLVYNGVPHSLPSFYLQGYSLPGGSPPVTAAATDPSPAEVQETGAATATTVR